MLVKSWRQLLLSHVSPSLAAFQPAILGVLRGQRGGWLHSTALQAGDNCSAVHGTRPGSSGDSGKIISSQRQGGIKVVQRLLIYVVIITLVKAE